MKRLAFILAVFAALTVVVASADAAGIGSSQAPKIKVKNGYSTNWAGYAVPANSGDVTDVVGTWTVPTLQQCGSTATTTGGNVRAGVASNGKAGHGKPGSGGGTTGYSSTWVGIDGDNSNTVEQIGTEQDCINGSAQYYAWYEMYPQYPTNLSTGTYPVQPGDTITAEVEYTSGNSFTLTLNNKTQKWKFTTDQSSSSAKRSSAEWIVEAPWSGRVLPLADFGNVSFSSAQATIGGTTAPVGTLGGNDSIIMVTKNGTVKASPDPTSLGSGDSSFSVNWFHQ